MSRIDGQIGPLSHRQRLRIGSADVPLSDAGLIAPGISAPQPLTRGQQIASQLDSILGAATGLVAEQAQLRYTRARAARFRAGEAEQARRQAEQERQQQDQIMRGLAARDRNIELAKIRADIEGGVIVPPATISGSELEPFARQILEQRIGPDADAAYRDEWMRGVTEVMGALLGKSAENFEANRKEILSRSGDAAVGLDEAGLREMIANLEGMGFDHGEARLPVVRAMQTAAERGLKTEFEEARRALGGEFALEQEAASDVLRGEIERAKDALSKASAAEVLDLIETGAPFETVQGTIGQIGDRLLPEDARRLRALNVSAAQERRRAALDARAVNKNITAEELGKISASMENMSPDDPRWVDPIHLRELANSLARTDRIDLAKQQVAEALLSGKPVLLTDTQHGDALAEMVGPEGVGMIDASNRIVDPAGLGAVVAGTGLAPIEIRQTMYASLMSSDPVDVANAGVALGQIAVGNPRAYAKIINDASIDAPLRAAIDAAAEQYRERGSVEAASVRAAIESAREPPRLDRGIIEDMSSQRPSGQSVDQFWSEQVNRIMREVRGDIPHTTNAFWIDPSLNPAGLEVSDAVRGWFQERYRQRSDLPRERRIEESNNYAKSMVREHVDFVRWDGAVTPVFIQGSTGVRLPEGLRWGAGFEKEARRALSEAGHDPEKVVSAVPFLSPAEGQSFGWTFMVEVSPGISVPLTSPDGRLVIWTPDDRAARENERYRSEIDRREREFNRRSGQDKFKLGFDPAFQRKIRMTGLR